jgi:hypothetical protein
MSASGMILPDGSTTWPLMLALVDWAIADVVMQIISKTKRRVQL